MEKTPREGRYRDGSFGLLKFVSWGTLVLTLLASLFMSIFLANLARQVLLEKQHEFARLWAETLNHNISRRFALPAVLQFGELNLANPEQYKRLESVVRSVLEDFPVQDLRIFTPDGVVGFALDKSLVGEKGLGGEAVALAVDESKLTYEIIYQTGALGAMFSAEIAPRSVVMRTMAPLRFKATIAAGPDGPSDPSDPDAQNGQGGQSDAGQTPAVSDGAALKAPAASEGTPPGADASAKPDANQPGPGRGVKMVSINEVIGALEFTQDITSDYQKLITFQRVIILSALLTALLIFFVLRMLIHRADRINAQRMREREEYEREAVQNEKLVSMGRMVAGIAHEIRNPLGIIRSSAELLVSRLKDKDPLTAKIMAAIHEEAVRLSKTVGDFLDYARPRTLKLDPLDLGLLLDQALTFLEQKCREQRVEVVRDYPVGVMVSGDKDMLYRALYNILVNALEAMSAQKIQPGQPSQEDAQDVAGQIVVRVAVEKSAVRLRIMDTGPGIPPDIRDKLLDPFFTTKDSGTGLGLAITANILRSHDAVIELGDNPEGGARVDILFPKP